MVTLSRIYTRTGDGGQTRLGNNLQVSKTDRRVEAYGAVDELNAAIGLVLSHRPSRQIDEMLRNIQHELFDLGADLCCPEDGNIDDSLRVPKRTIKEIEAAIDLLNADLNILDSFILPGGTTTASCLHLARTVCRRAERQTCHLAEHEKVNSNILVYLNRLSDLLFVMARWENGKGSKDVLWSPRTKTNDLGD